jgi:hypothetical protein
MNTGRRHLLARYLFAVAGLASTSLVTMMVMTAFMISPALIYDILHDGTGTKFDPDVPVLLVIPGGLLLVAALARLLDPERGRHWLGRLTCVLVLLVGLGELAFTSLVVMLS